MWNNLPKEVRVHVGMTNEMYEALRKLNAETGVPLTEIVRRALQAHLTPAKESRIVGSPAPVFLGKETR